MAKIANLKIFVVIPTIRNLDFFKAWKNEFVSCHLIVVEDNVEKTINTDNLRFASITHLCHGDIENDFGKNSWIFSRKNAGIRCYGFWKAYQAGADVILTLDDDCYPVEKDFVKKHIQNLEQKIPEAWQPTYPNFKWLYTRGFPYKNRNKYPTMISHGLWCGALDLDAKTELKLPKLLNEKMYPSLTQFIPFGFFYPMCSMNLAFRREIVPLMFFPMMSLNPRGVSWKFDRYDDIWAGIFSKKIMDHLGMGVVNGSPFVNHKKASITKHNHIKEFNGMKVNETPWKAVFEVNLTKNSPKTCYIELAEKIKFPKDGYFVRLREAMIIWANLY
jgi:hypothetical protein